MTHHQVADAIRRWRFSYTSEDRLQEAIDSVLREEGFDPRREVRLSSRDRIDLMVGRVGIEVKVAGSTDSVLRQLCRYAESDEVDALILVTARVRHVQMVESIDGKPLQVVTLAAAGL